MGPLSCLVVLCPLVISNPPHAVRSKTPLHTPHPCAQPRPRPPPPVACTRRKANPSRYALYAVVRDRLLSWVALSSLASFFPPPLPLPPSSRPFVLAWGWGACTQARNHNLPSPPPRKALRQ